MQLVFTSRVVALSHIFFELEHVSFLETPKFFGFLFLTHKHYTIFVAMDFHTMIEGNALPYNNHEYLSTPLSRGSTQFKISSVT